jgi:O-antigen biosynthesis protein
MNLCAYLLKFDPSARVVVIGEIDNAEHRQYSNLTVHGRYDASELPDLIERYGINICLLPSIWPETFSYVTQEIMVMDLPLVCFDLGAPAERVKMYLNGTVVPLSNSIALYGAISAIKSKLCYKKIDISKTSKVGKANA